LWIGLLGLLLLLGGAGLWFYTTRMAKPHPVPVPVETAANDPAPQPAPQPPPLQPEPEHQAPPVAAPVDTAPAPAPPPSSSPKPEVIPPNPDFAKKTPPPAPPPPVAEKPTSGSLHAAVEVAQYGEVVFEGLPNDRLRLSFDHDAWQPTIHRQPNGTQTLIMRSLKQGIQRSCDVKWEIVK
jgi:outer membrane biosynthesis protein TonB